jgi:phosphoribosylaminoimidazole-succinocarboxamide synthase
MISDDLLRAQLQRTLDGTDLGAALGAVATYAGKVRDNYSLVGGTRVIVVSDRLSAFDVVLGTIPFKGQVLNQLAAYWFEATRHIAPNHVLDVPDPNVTRAIECQPLPVEMVVRSYLTGVTSTSIWRHYEAGARVYAGHRLPDGMKKNQPLPHPLLTPSTKAEKGGHDETVSREELIARGHIDGRTFDQLAELCLAMFAFGQARARERGLVLVDTKYELGRAPDGRIVFIDEVHTPDSSRYWYAEDLEARVARGEEPRSLDKEYVRRHFAARGYTGDGTPPPIPDDVRVEAARRYIAAYEQVTGHAFVPNSDEPHARIRRNLGIA